MNRDARKAHDWRKRDGESRRKGERGETNLMIFAVLSLIARFFDNSIRLDCVTLIDVGVDVDVDAAIAVGR